MGTVASLSANLFVEKTRAVSFTIPDGQQNSDWKDPLVSGVQGISRLMRLWTDPNCPTTTLTVSVREKAKTVATVLAVPNFSLGVTASSAYGASDLANLSSLLDGFEMRLTLGSAPSGDDTVIKLGVV